MKAIYFYITIFSIILTIVGAKQLYNCGILILMFSIFTSVVLITVGSTFLTDEDLAKYSGYNLFKKWIE